MSQLIHVLSHEMVKCLLCNIVFINAGDTTISVKRHPDMYLSYQLALTIDWLIGYMNHVLYNRLGQDSIVLCVMLSSILFPYKNNPLYFYFITIFVLVILANFYFNS